MKLETDQDVATFLGLWIEYLRGNPLKCCTGGYFTMDRAHNKLCCAIGWAAELYRELVKDSCPISDLEKDLNHYFHDSSTFQLWKLAKISDETHGWTDTIKYLENGLSEVEKNMSRRSE